MESNFWEEQRMQNPLLKFHSDKVEDMKLPEWIKEIKCPFCKEQVNLRGIRNIQLCLNTRNFGEIAIQVFCDDCVKMDTLYFRTKIRHIDDFIGCLYGNREITDDPVLEEDMYKINYNNILEIMTNNTKEEDENDNI